MTRKAPLAIAALAVAALAIGAPAAGAAPAPERGMAPAVTQVEVPEHAVITCQSATMYQNYNWSIPGPVNPMRTLEAGNKVGHTRGAHPVYNGWASIQDFGPNDWGFVRIECLGGWGSW